MPIDDRAQMIAYMSVENTLEAYRQWWREKKAEKDKKGANMYDTMKAMHGIR